MARYRDVQAFADRAPRYESGWRGDMHRDIARRTATLAVAIDGGARRVLDVGCGTGLVLRELSRGLADAEELLGVDAAAAMVDTASALTEDRRLRYSTAVAENLPFDDGRFDLVVSATSFDHWEDQAKGLSECARVLRPGGHLVMSDVFSVLLLPTLLAGHRGRARTRGRAGELLGAAGFGDVRWHRLYQLIIQAAVASKVG